MFFGVKRFLQYALHSFFLKPHERLNDLEKTWIIESVFLLDIFSHGWLSINLQMLIEWKFGFLNPAINILFDILVKYSS